MKPRELKMGYYRASRPVFGVLLGCALIFGPGVSHRSPSTASMAPASKPAPIVVGFEFAKAHAGSRRRRILREGKRRAAQRKAAEERQKEADKKLLGNKLTTLPPSCMYDSYASFSTPTEIHVCGAYYYRPYEEDGVTGFQGFPIGTDPEEIKRAKARRAKARKKRLAAAEKKLKANRKTSLSTDCSYDSFASLSSKSNVYTCGGIQFQQVRENGVTVFDRRGIISEKTKQELARRAKAQAKRRAEAGKASQAKRVATLPKGCTYDSYASFFTSSNVYACNGVRYRQYQDAGATGFQEVDL